ncbi:hypothetical protein [Mesorhizobium sp.]|uniref:hypothetical protein n=2 Tax=Mesorhizobium TaxID=68287 RepID=UPI00257DFABA|nr:hypothetical protein [Mesorhizobium sp.]
MQPLRDGLVAQATRNQVSDFLLAPCELVCGLGQRSRHQEMLEDVVVDPFSTGRYDIYAFDKIAIADAVQQQAVGVELLNVLDAQPAVWLQDENYAQRAVHSSQSRGETGRLLTGNVHAYDDNIRPMALYMRDNVNYAMAVCHNAVASLPQNPLQTGEIYPPRVRNNQG